MKSYIIFLYFLLVTTIFCQGMDLQIIKTGSSEVRLGEEVLYVISVKNVGDKPLSQLVILDQVPEGFKYKGRETGSFTFKWNIEQLLPGEEKDLSYHLSTMRVGEFTCITAVRDNHIIEKARFVTKVVAPDLMVNITSSTLRPFLNKLFSYTITIENRGSGTARDLEVLCTLPEGLEYIGSEKNGLFKPPREKVPAAVKWNFAELEASEKIELKVVARAVGSTNWSPRTITSVKVTSEGTVLEDEVAIRICSCGGAHLSTYDTEDPIETGDKTIYVITARNEATSAMTNIIFKNYIADEMCFIRAEGPCEYIYNKETRQVVFASIDMLMPGDSLVFKIICVGIKEGSSKNIAQLKYKEFGKEIIDEEGTNVYGETIYTGGDCSQEKGGL